MTVADAIDVTPDSAPAQPRGRFVGADRPFWRLLVRGAMLLIVTLGLYRFWLVTDIRRYLWTNSEIAGDGLEYVGTARELLLGFLIAVALLVPVNVAFFVGTLSKGILGQISGLLGLLLLALLGQFAVYRARRYRLTRTVLRGLRFRQTGSAWRYAVCALFWWVMIALTLGLAYPWAQASLERFKVGHTYYGDLKGYFVGSGTRLFIRGLLMWLAVMAPLFLGLVAAVGIVDWGELGDAMQRGGDDVAARLESAGIDTAFGVLTLAVGLSVIAAALLYPAFQAMMLRWWVSGLRFGVMAVTSRLRTRSVYALYMRFVWIAMLLGAVLLAATLIGLVIVGELDSWFGKTQAAELATTGIVVVAYVMVALSYSTIYQATVKLRLWKLGFDTVELSGIEALDRVKAVGTAGSAVGEGLADALNVGGY